MTELQARAESLSPPWRRALLVMLMAVGYFAAANLSYAYEIRPANVAIVWVPSGLMLAVLLILDTEDWWLAVAGGFIGNLVADHSVATTTGVSLAGAAVNALEVLAAAAAIRVSAGRHITLDRLSEVGLFIAGGPILANAVTAFMGALVLIGPSRGYWDAYFSWWFGDGMGMLLVAPLILSWSPVGPRGPADRRRRRARLLEAALFFPIIVAVSLFVLGTHAGAIGGEALDPYAMLPFLVWAAFRFGRRGATSAVALVAAITLWFVAQGRGPFADFATSHQDEALDVYVFLLLASVTSLTTAAMLRERSDLDVRHRRLAGLLDAATDFVTIGQPLGPPIYINPAARRMLEIGNDAVPSLLLFRPPGFEAVFRDTILPAVARDGIWRGETEYVSRSGRVVPVSQVSVAQRRADGSLAYVSTISRDISAERAAAAALQASEERMRFALTSAQVGLWEANITTDVSYWSESMEAIHGLRPGTFGRTQQAFLEAVHPDDRASVRDAVGRAMRDHRDAEIEYRTRWPDGTVRLLQSTAHFTYDEAGAPIRGAGVARDITNQRLLEDQFRQAQKMEAVGQLAGGIAHDFNNLLTAIQGYALLVRDSLPADDARRADVEEITHASARAAALTRQLLAFSRKQILSPQVLHLRDVVAGLMPMLRRILNESIELQTVFHDEAAVRADAGQLEQVLMNLAVNARDAMPDGGRLTIETGDLTLDTASGRRHTDVPAGRYVTLVVTDTGHGMDSATKRRIFEPFFTTKPRGQGTGLGLATVHGIVKQSGGHIWVYSEPGHGTTFKVCLPRTDEVGTPVAEPEAAAPVAGSGTVLLVEDEGLVRRFAQTVLTSAGYTVLAADTPSAAMTLASARRDPIDVVLTDVIMPEMNGRVLATRLAELHPEARVVYMSGYTDTAIVHQGFLEPGMRFLQKPFGASVLVEKVRDAAGATARSA